MKIVVIEAGKKAKVVETENEKVSIKQIRELVGAFTVCYSRRKIGGKYYDLWHDEEAELGEYQKVISGILNGTSNEVIVGNMVILKRSETALDDEDVEEIFKPNHLVDNDSLMAFAGKDPRDDYYLGETTIIKAHSQWLVYEGM